MLIGGIYEYQKWFMNDESDVFNDGLTEQYYNLKAEDALEDGASKLVLLEPRAFSEAQQIADQLKIAILLLLI